MNANGQHGSGVPASPGLPAAPENADIPFSESAPQRGYDSATRKPVIYLPVVLGGEPIGYLWAAVTDHAAGFVRRAEALERAFRAPMVWDARLDEAHERGVPARDAVRRWIGAPEDPEAGAIPAGTTEREAAALAEVDLLANPDLPPPAGPLVQDGEFPDGTPVDRAKGWGPLTLSVPPSYASEARGPVRYLTVVRDGVVLGYLWASLTGDGASYLERQDAGLAGVNAGVPLILKLRESYEAGLPPLDAIRRCEGGPVGVDAEEREAASLGDLRALAAEHTQSLRLTFPPVGPDGAVPGGRPLVPEVERDAVQRYLEEAPVVYEGSGPAADLRDPGHAAGVPTEYRTDGTWVWPGGVPYYLRVHGVPPEADLLAHIRANDHRLPPLGEPDLAAAVRTLEWNGILTPPPE
ncbi:hypothetical protein [Actinomadura roseirufa]|uniref:hypothetical protein n=1 Tax=Actinomadura roseirufa TaxID=2094049 RepID=UPI001041BC15|nr:hypothetical protein [Actinomadura roseirufa]